MIGAADFDQATLPGNARLELPEGELGFEVVRLLAQQNARHDDLAYFTTYLYGEREPWCLVAFERNHNTWPRARVVYRAGSLSLIKVFLEGMDEGLANATQ